MTTPNNLCLRVEALRLAKAAASQTIGKVSLSTLVEACSSSFSDPETYEMCGEMYRIALGSGVIRLSASATELLDHGPQGGEMWTAVRGDHEVAVLAQVQSQLSPVLSAA